MRWSPYRRVEFEYGKALKNLIQCLTNLVQGLELDTPEQVMEAFQQYVTKDFFISLAQKAAKKMITQVRFDQQKTWREAAKKSSRGRQIYLSLKNEMKGPIGRRINQLVDENALLISTFPENISDQVAHWILDQQQKGLRPAHMAELLKGQFPNIADSRLMLIARTETSKASTALIQARSESLDIRWYVWRTSKDARVRPSHYDMDGVVIPWNEPPAPEELAGIKSRLGHYHAGNAPNCRCYPEPVIGLTSVSWPAKVYYHGRIRSMTQNSFAELAGLEKAA